MNLYTHVYPWLVFHLTPLNLTPRFGFLIASLCNSCETVSSQLLCGPSSPALRNPCTRQETHCVLLSNWPSAHQRRSWPAPTLGWARRRPGRGWRSWCRAGTSGSQSSRFSSSGGIEPSWLCIHLETVMWCSAGTGGDRGQCISNNYN